MGNAATYVAYAKKVVDMPEGKEGGAAFLAKRKPGFWKLREREANARQALLDAYQGEHPSAAAGD